MSIWTPDLQGRGGPLYRAIVDALADDVRDGRLAVGSRLPPQRDLAFRLGVTVGTVARAYAEAEKRGLVSGEVGRGTYVRDPRTTPEPSIADYFAVRRGIEEPVLGMTCNHPSRESFATEAIRQALHRLAASPDLPRFLEYQLELGGSHTNLAAARWLQRHGVEVPGDRALMTVGGQQAMLAVVAAATVAGEAVMCEELTYPGLKTAAAMLDRRLIGLPLDRHGLDPKALERCLAARQSRVLYCVPTNQNPTNAVMPAERRAEIARLLRQYDAILIEDGTYAFLSSEPPQPIAALVPERAFFITSLSKSVAPSIRIGVVGLPDGQFARVAGGVSASSLQVPTLMAELASILIMEGTADQAARTQLEEMKARQAIARQILGDFIVRSEAAYALWLPLPAGWRADTFVNEGYRRGVAFTPAGAFAVPKAQVPEAVRISICAADNRDELVRGLKIIRQMLEASPTAFVTV